VQQKSKWYLKLILARGQWNSCNTKSTTWHQETSHGNQQVSTDGFLLGGGVGISDADKEIIYDRIRESTIEIAAVEIGHQHEQQQQPEQILALHKIVNQQPTLEDDIFDEIINHYIEEYVHRGDAEGNLHVNKNAATTADAQITSYKQEVTLQLRKDDGTFNCPLIWWKYNEQK
jgi:hypothetical protein